MKNISELELDLDWDMLMVLLGRRWKCRGCMYKICRSSVSSVSFLLAGGFLVLILACCICTC